MAFAKVLLFALASLRCTPALGDTNVYGQPMTACGPYHAGGCAYMAYDAGAHEVCVTELPEGFSSETGQGPWSNEFTGQPWCICIWAYSNYILHTKDLPLKCESIPSKVLEERYSLDKFEQCGSMSSTDGCGPEDIRRSIQSLCEQCDRQAADQAARSTLKAKCDGILALAPAAPTRLNIVDDSITQSASAVDRLSPLAVGLVGLAVAFTSVVAFARSHWRKERSIEVHLLGDDSRL
jgi:hypothetical protein